MRPGTGSITYNVNTGGRIPPGRCSRMPPSEPHREELTWSWAWSTGRRTSDQRLEPAAKAAWSYALLCAWVYLNDRDYAHDLMDHAVQNAAGYLGRHPESPDWKLIARIKSVLRRRAKQIAHKHRLEIPSGSLRDLEGLLIEPSNLEQRSIASELVSRLSPIVQSVHNQRQLGYTWREIAAELELDHTVVRRAYFRELKSLLRSVSPSGESPR
jgi:DNA-binding NarL/FixJ family response regulator